MIFVLQEVWMRIHKIHNKSLQPFSMDYDLVSHTTYVMLRGHSRATHVPLTYGGTYSLKSTPNDRFLRIF